MDCRICGTETIIYDTYEHCALEVSRLYTGPTESEGLKVIIYRCPICNHYQIPYINTENYYDDYVMVSTHSPKIQALQRAQAEQIHAFAVRRDSFVEIGCGDGSFLSHAKGLFGDVLGVEPSKPHKESWKRRQLNVVNDYLHKDLVFPHSFDAFASRQVFEHIPNPVEVLTLIKGIIHEDSVGLVEVPNGQKMLSDARYFDVFTDHINYFTPLSLSYLAKVVGLDVMLVRESFGCDYIEMYVKKKGEQPSFAAKRDTDFGCLKDVAKEYQTFSAWGAGAKTQAIMSSLGNQLPLKYLFDTDPFKIDKFVVNCTAPITSPTAEKINENELIIIFAVSYQDEILRNLREDFGYRGDVLCLDRALPHPENIVGL